MKRILIVLVLVINVWASERISCPFMMLEHPWKYSEESMDQLAAGQWEVGDTIAPNKVMATIQQSELHCTAHYNWGNGVIKKNVSKEYSQQQYDCVAKQGEPQGKRGYFECTKKNLSKNQLKLKFDSFKKQNYQGPSH